MTFQFCPHCGTKAVLRELGDEGLVPWCEPCSKPLFPMFSTCIIAVAVDEAGRLALLRQGYISQQYHVLVSGYMKPGETAEACAAREIGEELGLTVTALGFTGTYWLGHRDMLMLGYVARVKSGDFHLSSEVDGADWVAPEEALSLLAPAPATSHLVVAHYLQNPGLPMRPVQL